MSCARHEEERPAGEPALRKRRLRQSVLALTTNHKPDPFFLSQRRPRAFTGNDQSGRYQSTHARSLATHVGSAQNGERYQPHHIRIYFGTLTITTVYKVLRRMLTLLTESMPTDGRHRLY